jgi:SAM-dependent methyltransferase
LLASTLKPGELDNFPTATSIGAVEFVRVSRVGAESDDDAEVTRLIERIRQRIGLGETPRRDQELLQHFNPFPERKGSPVVGELLQRINQLRRVRETLPPFPTASRVPGGRYLHRLIGKSVRRDTAALADQIDRLSTQVAAAMEAMFLALSQLTAERDEHQDQVRALERTRFVDSLDRLWGSHEGFEARLSLIESQIPAAATPGPTSEFHPKFSSLAFAERFRGSREDILLRYADVADLLVGTDGPVLDLGCGRGELVELIIAKGGSARGVEADPELVAYCRSLFLDVTESSALDALNDVEDDSLGGVAMIQVVEHLSAQELAHLVPLANRKLKPGGLFVAETVNGTSPFVFTRSFFADPRHRNPVHHEYFQFLLEESGFSDTRVEWRALVDASDRLSMISESPYRQATAPGKRIVEDTNERLKRLDEFLFAPQDFLIVARK